MTWDTPITWADGVIYDEDDFNEELRDKFLWLKARGETSVKLFHHTVAEGSAHSTVIARVEQPALVCGAAVYVASPWGRRPGAEDSRTWRSWVWVEAGFIMLTWSLIYMECDRLSVVGWKSPHPDTMPLLHDPSGRRRLYRVGSRDNIVVKYRQAATPGVAHIFIWLYTPEILPPEEPWRPFP